MEKCEVVWFGDVGGGGIGGEGGFDDVDLVEYCGGEEIGVCVLVEEKFSDFVVVGVGGGLEWGFKIVIILVLVCVY